MMSRFVLALLLQRLLFSITPNDAAVDIPPTYQGSADDELKVLIIGDWGYQLFGIFHSQQKVAKAMSVWADTNQPAWIQSVGDNIYPVGIFSWDDQQVDCKWRDVYDQPSLRSLRWHMALGNHDYDWNHEWNQVELSKHDPRWYQPYLWYDYVANVGNHSVHFIVIDTEAYNERTNNYTVMETWLDDTLTESTADWKIVVGHRTMYSAGLHGPITTSTLKLLTIMERHKVDVYVCGHDHNLQHLRNVKGDGLDFVVSGAGGAMLYAYRPDNALELLHTYGIETKFFESTHGFVALTTTKTELTFDYYDEQNENIYSFVRCH